MLAIGGRILLDCPCEGGLSGTSQSVSARTEDTGCPRCMRVSGPVLVTEDQPGHDLMLGGSKRATLEWLRRQGHLPGTATTHIKEKYEGIDDVSRIMGPDVGTRTGCLQLIRRIVRDRLGLELDNEDVASFDWLDPSSGYAGLYTSGFNTLAILKDLIEWSALDILSHEFFHNLQWKSPGLFDHTSLGKDFEPQHPFEGKIFIEGSAMWAESHVVDALAIRSALTSANLRQGDEYGEGFQLIKYIEENLGGVPAVLDFLACGDISTVTGGKIRDLEALYAVAGIATK